MGGMNLAVGVLQQVHVAAVKHTPGAQSQGGGMAGCVDSVPRRLHADQSHLPVFQKLVEQPDGVAASIDAGHAKIRQASLLVEDLTFRLPADHPLEIPHDRGVGMGSHGGAEDVVGALQIRDPITEGLVDGVFEGAASAFNGNHFGAQQAHAEHVEGLPFHVLLPHVHGALHTEQSGHRGGGYAVLTGTGFGDDPCFPHAPGQEDLADRVVDLMGSGVIQILPLQIDPGPAPGLGQAGGKGQRCGAAVVLRQVVLVLGLELRVPDGRLILRLQLLEGRHDHLRNELSPEIAEISDPSILCFVLHLFLTASKNVFIFCRSLMPGRLSRALEASTA